MDTFDRVISKALNVDHWMSRISNWILEHVYWWVIMMLWLLWLQNGTMIYIYIYIVCPFLFLWLWICPTTWPWQGHIIFKDHIKTIVFLVSFFLILQTYMLNITLLFTRPKASNLVMGMPITLLWHAYKIHEFFYWSIGEIGVP